MTPVESPRAELPNGVALVLIRTYSDDPTPPGDIVQRVYFDAQRAQEDLALVQADIRYTWTLVEAVVVGGHL